MSLLDDPTLWKQRALQMREIAETEPEVSIKKALIDLAERYEGLADRAKERRPRPRTAQNLNSPRQLDVSQQ